METKAMIETHTVNSGRAALHAEIRGEGLPVVFLHAAVADTRMWSDQMAAIGSEGKAIAYDRRGFGKTKAEPEDYSSVGDLMTLLDEVGDGKRAILVGCSQGGRVVLDAALEHPTRVSGLILVAPNVTGAPEPKPSPEISQLLAEQAEATKGGDIDRINAVKARLWLDGPLQTEGRVSGRARELLIEMNSIVLGAPPVGTDLDVTTISPAFDRLSEINVPSMMIWGDMDFPHIKERCRIVADRITNCTSIELTGSAHLPSLDKSNELTAALLEFMGRTDR